MRKPTARQPGALGRRPERGGGLPETPARRAKRRCWWPIDVLIDTLIVDDVRRGDDLRGGEMAEALVFRRGADRDVAPDDGPGDRGDRGRRPRAGQGPV